VAAGEMRDVRGNQYYNRREPGEACYHIMRLASLTVSSMLVDGTHSIKLRHPMPPAVRR
jgi:hypothetical protein